MNLKYISRRLNEMRIHQLKRWLDRDDVGKIHHCPFNSTRQPPYKGITPNHPICSKKHLFFACQGAFENHKSFEKANKDDYDWIKKFPTVMKCPCNQGIPLKKIIIKVKKIVKYWEENKMEDLHTFQALNKNNDILLTTLSHCIMEAVSDIYTGFFRKKLYGDLYAWKRGGKRILDKKAGVIYRGNVPKKEGDR